MNQSIVSEIIHGQSEFIDQFNEYVYSLAERQNSNELRSLFQYIPSLVNYHSHGKYSIAWAMLSAGHEYGDREKECLRLLREMNYSYAGTNFVYCIVSTGNLSLIQDFCDVFGINPSDIADKDCMSVLHSAFIDINLLNLDNGIPVCQSLLDQAIDIEAPSLGIGASTPLFKLFMNGQGVRLENTLCLINLVLAKGANPNTAGMVNGWAHKNPVNNDGESLPLLHAVYWSIYADRNYPEILALAKQICDTGIVDSRGLTAEEYYDFLVETNAPK